MASKSVSLSVRPRGQAIPKIPETAAVALDAPASDIYHRLSAESGLSVHRLRVTKGSDGSIVPNRKEVRVGDTGLREGSVVYVKDLGPQISWTTVFLVEYLGPLLVHPLIYYSRPFLYRKPPTSNAFQPPSSLQTTALTLVLAHFLKRELETLFVHRFSLATMPARNIFKNCFHYWVLAGLNLAYWIYSPSSPTAAPANAYILYPALALWGASEAGNLYTHVVLRNLRSRGGKERGIPRGWAFELVTCPNYMFEVGAWLGIWLVTWSLAAGVMAVAGGAQMWVWARKKESAYRKEFGAGYSPKRYVMIPGVC